MKNVIRLFVFLSLFIFGNVANAQPLVGVIFDAPSILTNDEAKMQQLDKKLREIFTADKCILLPSKELTDKAMAYRTANNMMVDGESNADQPLTNAVLSELGRQAGCRYVLLLDMKRLGEKVGSTPALQKNFGGRTMSFGDNKSLLVLSLTDVQVVNVSTGNYEYKKQILSLGVDSVTRILGMGGKPQEDKAMGKMFESFIEYLNIKPTAIP